MASLHELETLEIRKLKPSDEAAFLKAFDQWDHDSGFTWTRGYEKGMDFKKYMHLLDSFEKDENLPEGYVEQIKPMISAPA